MSTSPIPVNSGRRRSPRIAVLSPVQIAGEDSQKCAFSEAASATNVNLHGAAIQLDRQLIVGSVVTLTNREGITAPARIVAQVGVATGAFIYGVEFVLGGQPNFWGISFAAQQ